MNAKRTMRNPAYFVGKIIRSTNWVIPQDFACCPTTGQLQPVTPESCPQDEEIAALVGCIRQQQQRAEDAAAAISAFKDRLEALLAARGENWSDEDGYARLVAPSVRVAYPREELDKLILADPAQYGWLQQYRKESNCAGRVMVK